MVGVGLTSASGLWGSRGFRCCALSLISSSQYRSPELVHMSSSQVLELSGPFVAETVVKKSRFIASACSASTIADAMSFIDLVRESDASHNCWAYRIDESQFRYSDDGEPSGTAGKPIYAAICSSKVERVVVVVTRYFGGIKLGAGGLIRAYNSAAGQCLKEAPKAFKEPTINVDVTVGWASIGAVQVIAERLVRLETVFDDSGCTISLRVPERDVEEVQRKIRNACGGAVTMGIKPGGAD